MFKELIEAGILPIGGGADNPIAYEYSPELFTNNDVLPLNKPGTRLRIKGKEYVYAQLVTTATVPSVGAPAYLVSQASGVFKVSALYSEGQGGTINDVVGVFGNVITNGYYGWIQVSGDFVGLLDTAGTAVVGDVIIGKTTANQTAIVTLGSSITNKTIGYVYVATSGGKVSAFLDM